MPRVQESFIRPNATAYCPPQLGPPSWLHEGYMTHKFNGIAMKNVAASLSNKWWAVTDLNCGPKDYESSALTN